MTEDHTPQAALEMCGVSKRFPGTLAVDRVDFEVRRGEVHALMGENGAGKSTLMNILAGAFDDYDGEILLDGRPVGLRSPAQAKARGIEMIHQELSLALPLSIAENLLAGRLPRRAGLFLDRRALMRETGEWLHRVGLERDPLTPVERLSQHEAQLVEIAKALSNRPSILVMDEPTSALSREEVGRLFELIAELKCRGLAIVYISHHLAEVFDVADRVTVLRDGRKVTTAPAAAVTASELVEMMIGGQAAELYAARKTAPGEERLRVDNISRFGFFHDVSFNLRQGEILGIGGLSGAGRSELARALCGIDPLDVGEIHLDGRPYRPRDYGDAIRRGFAYLTEDRKLQGLALRLSVGENVLAADIKRHCRLGFYSLLWGRGRLRELIDALQVHPPELMREISSLSGGNQQKVLLAKWLATNPEVLILDEPTRGVDVGAKAVIHRAIAELADRGKSVLLISSDLPELVGLSDRILIMRRGHIIGEMAGAACTEEAVLLAANGEEAVLPA